MSRLAAQLMELVGDALGDSGRTIGRAFSPAHTSYLRLNHYPDGDALAAEIGDEADLGIHHHTDAGALTVLLQDGVGGLQVLHRGRWHDVEALRGALTINIGDMVQVWSNDRYTAPLHRVLAMRGTERLSLAYFYNPSYDATVEPIHAPPLYRPITWSDFRSQRAAGDFARYG